MGPRFTEEQAREALARSLNWSEALRRLGMRVAGGNHRTLQKYARLWRISTEHFDPTAHQRRAGQTRAIPLEQILVAESPYSSRGNLKARLYATGLKNRHCELCGQTERWHGRRMALILDHANGVANDNRLENLRIVCPNCAATLDTHCGRNKRLITPRRCERRGSLFQARVASQIYCSQRCGAGGRGRGRPRPYLRKVERPPREQLLAEIAASSYLAVGRKYGVSDNPIRKRVRDYEREIANQPRPP